MFSCPSNDKQNTNLCEPQEATNRFLRYNYFEKNDDDDIKGGHMIYTDFESMIAQAIAHNICIRCAVVLPGDLAIMKALVRAFNDGLIDPILIGDKGRIEALLKNLKLPVDFFRIYNEKYAQAAICLSIDMVYGGDVQCIMKGYVKTSEFMHELLKRKNDFGSNDTVSMISFRTLPNYHKLIAFTDTGICPHPSLEQKRGILENAVSAMRDMGVDCPKVAVVTASDHPNQKMPESIDAAALKRLNEDGEIQDCIVDGPMTIDMALNHKIAYRKGFKSEVAGDADIILFPDLASASITSRTVTHITGKTPGILVVGTKVPIIICSRDSSEETKYMGILLAVAGRFKQAQSKM